MDEISSKLLEKAKRCAANIPRSLGSISISGSVSYGRANEYSDIEIDLVGREIPARKEIEEIITDIGGKEIVLEDEFEKDGALVSEFIWEDLEFEFVWTTFENILNAINPILEAKSTDHEKLVYIWTINRSIILRDEEVRLKNIKDSVFEYPKGLSEKIIRTNLKNRMTSRYGIQSAIGRKEAFILSERRNELLKSIFRIIFALNKKWEPYWKWVMTELDDIQMKPKDTKERIRTVLASDMLKEDNWIELFELYKETLDLIDISDLEGIISKKKDLIKSIVTDLVG